MLWYHVSSIYLGEKVIFTPKVPETISKGFGEDSKTKRVCVSPKVSQCLMGKSGVKTLESALQDIMQDFYYVYKVNTDVAIPAVTVHDYQITDEHWITEELEFTFTGEIPKGTSVSNFNMRFQ